MSDRVRVLAPVTTYNGAVGEYQFANGKFEGEISDAARLYFENAGYTVESADEPETDAEQADEHVEQPVNPYADAEQADAEQNGDLQ